MLHMYLKSLVLKGFKTFADKEELVFDSPFGITAIVGPNGCGKSNVVDSFRYILGEGNLRELRVHSNPDVIFAGTEVRKPMSLAEIMITFDNSDRTLPLEYSEVQVKRRTFKDGEGEFFINNQVVRLKDIRDLFLDSGLSAESLSIICQGRVDAVLSSKPEERRSIFEEAAGINKYKFRKIEAERKLIMSEQNLLRIADLRVEISEQLISLEAQAKAAREYKEILERLKSAELSAYKKQSKQLLQKKEEASTALEAIKKAAKEKEENRNSLLSEKIRQSKNLREIESRLDTLLGEIEALKEKIEEEKGALIVEKERAIFEEKGKLRDKKEEDRFIAFEISNIKAAIESAGQKIVDLQTKSREITAKSLEEFGEFKETINLTIGLSQALSKILLLKFGKSFDGLKTEGIQDKFNSLVESETARVKEEIESNKKEIAFKEKRMAGIKAEISFQEKVINDAEKQAQEFSKNPFGETIENLINKKNEALKLYECLKKEKENAQRVLDELENKTLEGIQGAEDSSLAVKMEIALAKIDSELAQIESRIREDYQMAYDDLLAYSNESANLSKSKLEIESMKMRLRELEPVNLLSIDEFEKCRERSSFIESQYQDMVMARENLKTLITELDLKAREDFLASMTDIAKNFSQVFSELFEGGEAQIIMEKEKDALEAGIEISVRPPHRKWLGLSLLSGGERALTAIALLFAILKTSPSPFCLLDEVDAALDDANVQRFTNYLKKFSKTTQILMITHNKRTMAAADTIYGVTMEEPGISKIVSMKLESVA